MSTRKEGKHYIDGITINADIDYLVEDKNQNAKWMENPPVQTQSKYCIGVLYALGFVPPERVNGSYPGDGYIVNSLSIVYADPTCLMTRVYATNDVYTDDFRLGTYSDRVSHLEVEWTWGDIYAGQRAEKYHLVTETKFYKVYFQGEVDYLLGQPLTNDEEMGPLLANKKAFEYPCFYYDPDQSSPYPCYGDVYDDPFSDKVMFMPDYTKMQKVPNPVEWTNKDRAEFIAEYVTRYGDPKQKDPDFDWSDYDIHHIIPREYGGTNDFDNLIPLPRPFHQKNVNSWWNNY